MGAGGLNGELRDNPNTYIDTILHHYQSNGVRGVRGGTHQQQFNIHTSAHTNPSFPSSSSFPTTNHSTNHPLSDEDMVCYSCSASFTIWKRKKTCLICRRDFCKECFRGGIVTPEPSVTNCLICRSLKAPHLHKELLQKIKIKDLCDFLQKKNVSFQNCKEKRELIQLVLESSPNPSQAPFQTRTPSQPTQHQRTDLNNDRSTNSNATRNSFTNESREGASNSSSSQTHSSPNENSADKSASDKKTALMRTIEDVKTVDQIYSLSIKELKQILSSNCVDFKGCCEKNELLEKVNMLWKDKNKSKEKNTDSDEEDEACKVCMDNMIDCVLLECGHMVTCMECSKKVTECPICRQNVTRIVKVFKA